MKKILSYIVLVSLVSLNNLTFVFAGNTDALQGNKESSIVLLDKLENKLDTTLDSIETKIKDETIKEQIAEKQQEIENYINEKQAEIKKENSSSDIKNIIEETTKVVTLKAVAGVTPTQDVTESISSQIEVSKNDLEKAQDTLIDSLKEGNKYTLMLKSKLTKEDILKILNKFDKNISLNDMFEEDGFSYFELEIGENSLLKKELLENIDSGEVPNNFLGIEIIKPELLKIGDENISISGEEIDKLWGIKSYNSAKYIDTLSLKTKENGKKLQIGIIDTGISYNHPDLKNQISKSVAGYDFVNNDNDPLDDQGHGTHVSGTIAGELNGAGVFGVNPNIELVGLKICDSSGFCPNYGVLKALEYAKEKKIDILNMSLGAKGNVATSPVCQAIKYITDAGVIVVAAAGNSNIDTSKFVPGGCSEAITVGAIDENNARAVFSNYGEKVDVAAPGVGIYSTYLNNGYKSLNGTSMATPHIVGVVSVLKTFKGELTTKNIKELFKNNTLPVQTESNKKIASQVDLEKILTSFGIGLRTTDTAKKEEVKNDTIPKNEENTTQNSTETQTGETNFPTNSEETKSGEEFILEDNSIIDESVGLVIQNPEEETTKINSAESEQQYIVSEESNESPSQINSINLNGGESQSEQIEINNIEEETIQEVLEENTSEEPDDSDMNGIQNSYTCSFNIGESCYISLTNANNTSIYSYSAGASGLSYATSSSKVTIYGNKVGTINFYVHKYNSSKRKYELLHTIVITITDPIKTLKATIGTTTFQENESTSINVTSGNGGYSVTSSNTSVAQISGSNTIWTVKGVGVGNATITIKDSKGKSGIWNITVTARNLTLSSYTLDVDKGVNGFINIIDGNGGYTLIKKNNDISVNLSGTRVTVYSNVVGTHTLQVKDSAGKSVSFNIRVLTPLQVSNFNSSIQKYIGETISYSVTSGNGGYSVTSSNTSVATVSPNYGGTSGTITAKGTGSATITLRDGAGKSVSLYLVVKEKALITNIEYTDKVESGYLGGIYFDTTGVLAEVGVEYGYNYIPTGTSIKTQIIPVNSSSSDKSYASFIVPNCTSSCVIYVRPYIKETGNSTRIYKNNGSWYQVNYGTTLLTSAGGGTKIANVGEEDFSEESNEEISETVENEVLDESSGENGENEYSETEESEEGVEVNNIFVMFIVALEIVGLVAILSNFDDSQPIFPVAKLKSLFAGISPLKNVLQINSKANLDGLAGKAGVGASKIYNVLVRKFSNVNGVDDIYNVAKTVKDVNLSKGAEVIIGEKEVAVSIVNRLKSLGWKETINKIVTGKGKLIVLEKGAEKINYREYAKSQVPGYIHNATIDLLKAGKDWKEIKFVTK